MMPLPAAAMAAPSPNLVAVAGRWALYAGLALLVSAAVVGLHLGRPAGRWPAVALASAAGLTIVAHVAAGRLSTNRSEVALQAARLAAAGVWAGGLVWLLLALRNQPRPQRRRLARWFSRMPGVPVGVVAATGVVLAVAALVLLAAGLLTELRPEATTGESSPRVQVSQTPGQPTIYTIAQPGGGTLQSYVDPDRPGPNQVHFTFFDAAGNEQPVTRASATATPPAAAAESLELLRLSSGHFVANADLHAGRWEFAVQAERQGGTTATSHFTHSIAD